ncbi:MAG: hypothetical protein M3O46_04485 [Myxococcota bacterium]|nr:hypothetical protein [Myxococcota bacterium]
MRRFTRRVGVCAFAISCMWALPSCPAPPTALGRAQQAAQEFNQDVRFGRNQLMMDHVAPIAREAFAAQHRAWGSGIRVADMELAGLRPHGDHELEVIVRVAWYRPEEQELRTTTLQQKWRDVEGWQLAEEKRLDGDMGLLGERIVYELPSARPPPRFPTVHLTGAAEVLGTSPGASSPADLSAGGAD